MTAPKDSPYKLLWILGLAMTLPMILLSGPLAGYLVAHALVDQLHLPGWLFPVLIGLGFLGSGWQTFLLIRKLNIKD